MPAPTLVPFSDRLASAVRAKRLDLGLSIRDAARQMGVTHPVVYHAEGGRPPRDHNTLVKVALWVGMQDVPIAELATDETLALAA